MHVKFIEYHKATSEVIWLRNFLMGLKVIDSISQVIHVYYDNNTTVFYSKNTERSSDSKYIDLKYYVVYERIKDNYFLIES